MRRAVAGLVLVAGLAGCLDFDAAYQRYCASGRCDVDAGSSDGGAGVDAGVDGGVADAGMVADAGCLLSPVDVWQSSETSAKDNQYLLIAPGIIAESMDQMLIWASYSTRQGYLYMEHRKAAGGFVGSNRTLDFRGFSEARFLKGTLSDRWTGTKHLVRHDVAGSADSFSGCATSDGGIVSPTWYGAEVLTPTDVLLVGTAGLDAGATVCRWTPEAGLVLVSDPTSAPGNIYLYDAHRTASGVEYVVGGDFLTSEATSLIFLSDGGAVSAPADTDTRIQYGWTEIDGVGDDAWVVSGSGLVARLQPDGSFTTVFDAGFALRSVSVAGVDNVWAVGDDGARAVHFDGTRWTFVTLPSSSSQPAPTWERVRVTSDRAGLVLSGNVSDGAVTPSLKAVVHSYRFCK